MATETNPAARPLQTYTESEAIEFFRAQGDARPDVYLFLGQWTNANDGEAIPAAAALCNDITQAVTERSQLDWYVNFTAADLDVIGLHDWRERLGSVRVGQTGFFKRNTCAA